MSSLRRSRPDEEDASLKRLQEISITRYEGEHSPLSARSQEDEEEEKTNNADEKCLSSEASVIPTEDPSKFLFPPVLKVSDVSSTPNAFPDEYTDLRALKIDDGQESELKYGNYASINLRAMNKSVSPTLSPNISHGPKRTGLDIAAAPLHSKFATLAPPNSRKQRTKSETGTESVGRDTKPSSSASSSPTLTSKKYFTLLSSPVLPSGTRRGSEPIPDGSTKMNFQQIQMSVTDRRWEKLRSILTAMKDEPVDVDQILQSSPPDLLSGLQEKISAQEELFSLQKELSSLHDALGQKELELEQVERERDSALDYIRRIKTASGQTDAEESNSPSPYSSDVSVRFYEQGIEGLKTSDVSKDNVLEIMTHLVKELRGQKSYLDRLMTVVVMRAPWMLDELDKVESYASSQNSFNNDDEDDDDEDNYHYHRYNESDDEVWC